MRSIKSEAIIERMKFQIDVITDKELSEYFGVSTQLLSFWKKNSVPFEKVVNFAISNNLSVDWLLFGTEMAEPLSTAKRMVLAAFDSLDSSSQLEAIGYLSGLKNGTPTTTQKNNSGQLVNGNNNKTVQKGNKIRINQSAGGNVKNMIGSIKK